MHEAISFYRSLTETIKCTPVNIFDFLLDIKNGTWQKLVEPIRKIESKKERQEAKQETLPCATISGEFHTRCETGLKQHSSYIAIDLDDLGSEVESTKAKLCENEFVVSVFTSASNLGLCAIFKIDGSQHSSAFSAITYYLYDNYGLQADTCGDISRVRFVTFDPTLYLNKDAKLFDKYLPKQEKQALPNNYTFIKEDFLEMVKHLAPYNDCDDYRTWISFGYALVGELKESGRDLYHLLSRYSKKYVEVKCDKQYDILLKSHNENKKRKSSIAVIYYYAKIHGVPFSNSISNLGIETSLSVAVANTVTPQTLPTNSNQENNSLEKFEPIRITTETPVPELVPIIKIGDSIVSTAENITMISGEAKSGKTALLSAILAGAIADGPYDGFENIFVRPNEQKLAVLHFETENSKPRHKTNHIATVKRVELHSTPAHFLSYNIRQEAFQKYRDMVEKICAGAAEKFGGIFIIIIDGAADFISSVNEEAEANEVIKWMEGLAIKYRVPLITVVHTNPNSDKERGHLGSQGQRKVESVLHIKREGDISTIEPKMLRNAGAGETPVIQFTYDKEKGYHVSCGLKEKLTQINKQAIKDQEKFAALPKLATKVFSQKALIYKEAVEAIMKTARLGETKSRNIFTEMKVHEFILQGEDKLWRLNAHLV